MMHDEPVDVSDECSALTVSVSEGRPGELSISAVHCASVNYGTANPIAVSDGFEGPFVAELGRLVVAAGRVEYVLKLCLKNLLDTGFVVGMREAERHWQPVALCEEIRRLACRKLDDQQQKSLSPLLVRATELAEQRNDMVHAFWTATPTGTPLRVRLQRHGKGDAMTVGFEKSHAVIVDDLRALRGQLEEVFAALNRQRRTW